jgi:hypothetical protein
MDGTYEKWYREAEPSKVGQLGQDLYKVWEEDGTAIGYADEDMIFGVEGDGVYEEPDFSDVEGGDEEEEWNSETDWDTKPTPPCWWHLLSEIEKAKKQ